MLQLFRFGFNRLQIATLGFRRFGNAVDKTFNVCLDGGKRRTDVVRNPGDQFLAALLLLLDLASAFWPRGKSPFG